MPFLWHRKREELKQELEAHLEMSAQDRISRGENAARAHQSARRELGNATLIHETARDQWGFRWLETLLQDLRYAFRMLRKSPGFTVVAVLTLALGIGANTATFSVVNGVLLNPLPYSQPDQLVALAEKMPSLPERSISYPNFLDWASRNHVFQRLAAYRQNDFNLTGSGEAQRVTAMQVSASFFPLLGVEPVIGRKFSPEDDRPGAAPVAMLAAGFWKSKFGGSAGVLGKVLNLDGTAYTIIGVVPTNFHFSNTNFRLGEVYVPIGSWNDPWMTDRARHMGIYAVGRLKPSMTIEQAHANMNSVAMNLAAAFPNADKDLGVALTPLKEHIVRDVRPMLLILLGAVGFVLLIACANVANLLLARATVRERELAIRTALGASRARLFRQLLTESVLLALAGGALGLLLAWWGTQVALAILPETLPRAESVQMDAHVLLFTLAASLLAGVLFGMAPAWKTTRPSVYENLKELGSAGHGHHRTQRIFVTTEMALAVVLLVGAGLMIRSLANLWSVAPGFNPQNVLTITVALPPSTSKESPDEVRGTLRQLTGAIAAVPGVKQVSLMDGAVPLRGDNRWPFWIEGQPKPQREAEMPSAEWYIVSPNYLNLMEIPLLRGRLLVSGDTAHAQAVTVIDDNFAQKYFPGQDPIGKRLNLSGLKLQTEIVGIVGHIKQWGLDNDASGPVQVQMYTVAEQLPDGWMSWMALGQALVVRTQAPNYPRPDAISSAIEQMNSEQVAYHLEPMVQIISDSLATRRFTMILLDAFAALALALASIGIYAVVSYVVGRRTHEIGVRIALGAQPGDVMKLILRSGIAMALFGIAVGLAAAFGLTQMMKAMLFGVSAADPATYIFGSAVVVMAALAASYIPARRATRVDPMVALRYE